MTLSRREKRMIVTALACMAVAAAAAFVVMPFLEELEALEHGVQKQERALREMTALSAEHRAMAGRWDVVRIRLARRSPGFTLFSFLESAAGEAGVKDRIAYMKPSVTPGGEDYERTHVEIKLEGVALNQVVTYLYAVENPAHLVVVDRLSVGQSRKDAGLLDAVLQVSTIRRKEGTP